MTDTQSTTPWPAIRTAGTEALLVSFADRLSDPANRAALAFQRAVRDAEIAGVSETSTSLVSVLVSFDEGERHRKDIAAALESLLQSRDWYKAALPKGRKLWRIPAAFGGDVAPQLSEAAAATRLTEPEAIRALTAQPLRVQTIGFAPGQPYLGELSPNWNIPRQTSLTPTVPIGAIAVAIRQLVLFSVSAPTGWRHVGQTAFVPFRPQAETPFVLQAGDEVLLLAVPEAELDSLRSLGPDGGATWEPLP